MKDFLITSHLLGGVSGFNFSDSKTDDEIDTVVKEVTRICVEIKKQVSGSAGRLMVAHLLGGTSGLKLSPPMTDQEIQVQVSLATRLLNEISKQVKKNHKNS